MATNNEILPENPLQEDSFLTFPEHAPDEDDSASWASDDADGNDEEASRSTPYDSTENEAGGKSSFAPTSTESSQETKAVKAGKLLVLVVLVCSAAGLGVATYFFAKNQDSNQFAAAFRENGSQVLGAAQSKLKQTVILLTSVATAMTSSAINQNSSFPFVTIPDFEIRTRSITQIAGSASIGWSPIVTKANKEAWEIYSVQNQWWVRQGLDAQGLYDIDPGPIPTEIVTSDDDKLYYQPAWQYAPAPTSTESINNDMMEWPWYQSLQTAVEHHRHAILSPANIPLFPEPFTDLLLPIMSNFSDQADIVGFLTCMIRFGNFVADAVTLGAGRMILETSDTCGNDLTYAIDGPNATYIGKGRLHDTKYDQYRIDLSFARTHQLAPPGFDPGDSTYPICDYTIAIYPTDEFESKYESNNPIFYAVVVICVFIFTTMVFVLYDWLVRLRQDRVSQKAARTTAIVASLFPKNVQDRILEEVENEQQDAFSTKRSVFGMAPKAELKQMLGSSNKTSGSESGLAPQVGRPIADLFTDTTVMFADICNFTAWSSTREPSQVFILLETIYQAFDEIADRRRVFKVETVGDCYVAVAGLPEPRPEHAVVMARFANDCLNRFSKLTKRMEVILGPDTADLGLRIGLHSGPVTAGVLRGQRARFQLFGDTVNTTARMESTGERNRIQISQETAQLLKKGGKGYWCHQREKKVTAKGKGEMQTYWLHLRADAATARSSSAGSSSDADEFQPLGDGTTCYRTFPDDKFDALLQDKSMQEKQSRLVDWNTEILATKLKVLIAFRRAHGVKPTSENDLRQAESVIVNRRELVINEVDEILWLPDYKFTDKDIDITQVDLGQKVREQLHLYIQTLAHMYRLNPFHNFEHASHVTMSVNKLFSRIIAPELDHQDLQGDVYSALHDHTYGITSDPLTQFAVHLAALIHDVDHPGVSNMQLIKERAPMAVAYHDQSMAEQNSIDIAWHLLMEDTYVDLRNTIYATVDELHRFRKLIVNTVMATDIMDKDLKSLRNARWEKAFTESACLGSEEESSKSLTLNSSSFCRNRKATIVIEHLIQASDVAHTMQHWHVYRKWNARFFVEMYKAYLDGRAETDPSLRWYEGELGFFDYYVIPLASKLKECGIFGVSSDEYLSYAKQNRAEWESRGRDLVSEMMDEARQLLVGALDEKHRSTSLALP